MASAAPARLVPSLDLVRRTIAAELAYTRSRMRVLERIAGNPIGIAYRDVEDGPIGLMARRLPSPSFNSVVGLRAGHARHIEPLVAWYRENGVKASRFILVPGEDDPALGQELARLGYYQSSFHVSLIGEPAAARAVSDAIAVERIGDAAAMEEFLDAYVAGWEFQPQYHDAFKANVRPWLGEAGWSLYLARIDGKPAAAGHMFIADGVAYLADSATDPQFRRRGCQAALLQRRLADAAAAGVAIACSGAAFLSTSHRNMERAGLRIQFMRAIWTERPSA